MRAEVLQHVENRLEPEVLDATLTLGIERHTQVLVTEMTNRHTCKTDLNSAHSTKLSENRLFKPRFKAHAENGYRLMS
jgi:hypothetical protein